MHEVVLAAARFWLDDEGFFRGEALPGADETLEGARAMLAHLAAIGGGRKRPFLMDIRPGRSISRDARVHLAGDEAAAIILCGALLVGTGASRVIGNFFLRLARPKMPLRLFTTEAEAQAWLRDAARAPASG